LYHLAAPVVADIGKWLGGILFSESGGEGGEDIYVPDEPCEEGAVDEQEEIGTIYVDPQGNAIPTPPGGGITGSADGQYIQGRDAQGRETGVRVDGPHNPRTHPDPRAQRRHAHVPGVTNPDGTPWLPVR
jgi:hypothetical protein